MIRGRAFAFDAVRRETSMSAHAHGGHGAGQSLNSLAFSATVHCLTGCAIGEVLGMVIGTALGWSAAATIVLSVALAFLFGYSLTSLPLLRSGMTLAAVAPLALASDTISITIMEIVDNTIMVAIPGVMDASLTDLGFWVALAAGARQGSCRRTCPPRRSAGPLSRSIRGGQSRSRRVAGRSQTLATLGQPR
jgi:hypothetical protein